MVTKNDLLKALTRELEDRNVEDASEVADSVVEVLDEDGAFDTEEEDYLG